MFVLRLTDAPLYKIRAAYLLQRSCKVSAKMQVYLRSLPNRSLSSAKIVQTECRTSSLLERYAEVQPIFCKDSAN